MSTNDAEERSDLSISFNPIVGAKSVKDYEIEIKKLKDEIFDLKNQLMSVNQSHVCNVPEIIYKNTEIYNEYRTKILDLENKLNNKENDIVMLKDQLEEMANEKKLIDAKYSDKIAVLEDENKRLIFRLTKMQSNENQLKSIINSLETNLQTNMTQSHTNINNLVEENSVLNGKMTELYDELKKVSNENVQFKTEYENIINKFHAEMNHLKTQLTHKQNTIQELECAKEMLLKEQESNLINLNTYINGMHKFKNILMERLCIIDEKSQFIDREINNFEIQSRLTPEAKDYLVSCNIVNTNIVNINELVLRFKAYISQLMKDQVKLEVQQKQVSNLNIKNTVDNLKDKIKSALEELNVCRGYMEKKAKENKLLKNEKAKLEAENDKIVRQLEVIRKYLNINPGEQCII